MSSKLDDRYVEYDLRNSINILPVANGGTGTQQISAQNNRLIMTEATGQAAPYNVRIADAGWSVAALGAIAGWVSAKGTFEARITTAETHVAASSLHLPTGGSSTTYLRGDGNWMALPSATTTITGIVRLNDTVTSTLTSQAATARAVKIAYDAAVAAQAAANTYPIASTTIAGIVQLNNTVTSTSTTQAATANAVKIAYDAAVAAQASAGASTVTTAAVLGATAGANVGDIGTYALLKHTDHNVYIHPGFTYSGSVLEYSGANYGGGWAPPGTWRAMGYAYGSQTYDSPFNDSTLFLRIS